MPTESNSKLSSRVSALESSVESLAGSMIDLKRAMDNNARETRDAIKELGDRLTHSQKIPWSALAAWSSVVLTICALVGGLVAYGIDGKIDYLNHTMREHIESPAHTTQVENTGIHQEKISALEKKVELLDISLQREMRDLNTIDSNRIEALDVRLQQEMRLLDNTLEVRINELEKRLDRKERSIK